jgi:peptidoglycan/xylan/chitin deacetylase (PgdA/CDA1 family)
MPFVAVCAIEPDPEPLQHCLRSLNTEGAEPVLVIGDHDRERSTAEDVAESVRIPVVAVHGQGIAALHNAALAMCPADVLALLDDDVVVARGWFAALTAAWERALADVAAIGGPLRLRVVGATPRWWRTESEAAFAAHDYGEAALTLDPKRETMHGGNVSFRCDALRGAEGFWPAYARGETRDWCSDEHAAQHTLGALGWKSLYEPQAIAYRQVHGDRVSYHQVLARRFRSAGRAAVLDVEGARADALGRAYASAVQFAAAPLRTGEQRRLMESSVELAASLGSLLAPMIGTRDFRPTGSTEFRPFVPVRRTARLRDRAKRRLAPLVRRDCPVVLLYHRVHPAATSGAERVSPRHFEEHLMVLRARADVVSVAAIVDSLRRRRLQSRTVAITFDDGYLDILTYVAPLLRALAVPATVFVATGHVESREPFFWNEIDALLSNSDSEPPAPLLELMLGGHRHAWPTNTAHGRAITRRILRRRLQAVAQEERARTMDKLRRWAGHAPDRTTALSESRPLSVGQLAELARIPGVDIGSHTVHHLSLGFQSAHVRMLELARAREQLDAWVGICNQQGLAYPFGIGGVDFDDDTKRLAAECGYAYAMSNDPGAVTHSSDTYALPRVAVPDVDGPSFARWLDRVTRAPAPAR